MKYFELSLNEEMNICIELGITPTELFILRLLFLSIDGDSKYLNNFISNSGLDLRQVLQSLQNKQIINGTYKVPEKGSVFNPKVIPFNKNKIKSYLREANELGQEFFSLYPMFININGKNCSIKNITKGGFFSIQDFCIYYAKTIKSSGISHERVMDALQFGIEHNLINFSILEFIASQKWNEIEYIRNSGNVNGYNNTELL